MPHLTEPLQLFLLEDIINSKEFYFLNTHFDHIGEKARTESSRLFIDEISKFDKYISCDLNRRL